ncbi:hypothetical protein KTT_58860 [Tengunoibacter tsumagoiensis]|uniref:Uncharacterized protein n=1 Tax=Tengunoibacter tsumagoiensis TaxID=2014871 RepID=A0A402AA25_9CHLR|nr:hypothetical protein KTT_58860 [Tengunoibacter tsumagoiensis]
MTLYLEIWPRLHYSTLRVAFILWCPRLPDKRYVSIRPGLKKANLLLTIGNKERLVTVITNLSQL